MSGFHHYLHQLRTLPFREVVRRASAIGKRIARDRAREVRDRVLGTTLPDGDFISRAFGGAFPDKEALIAHFRSRTGPSFFIDRPDAKTAVSGLARADRERVIAEADKACEHSFDLLGSGGVCLGDTIDWHRDFKTGYRWDPGTYYKDIKIPSGRADIKVPWELSRFYHAVTLGQAWWLTNDEKYAREFASQVSDWLDANRPAFGVNWNCTMDVAIRACNWIAGYSFFRGSKALTDELLLKLLKGLYQHGLHIRENLEYSETLTSNHYLSDVAGLVYLGTMFPEFREARGWKAFGIDELRKEMEKQVYPDGCDFEASTCYHRLVLELFFFSTLVAVVNDPGFAGDNYRETSQKIFGERYVERLSRMFEAVLFLLKPSGMMPQIGDNDSGVLHAFARREALDMHYLLSLGAVFFDEPQFKVREFGVCEEALWVFGANGGRVLRDMAGKSIVDVGSRSLPDAGWYVMRKGQDYLVVSCGPNGQNGAGGHAHNDKLSFELYLEGRDVIVDPGTYLYTPDPAARNAFRSTSFHNTVSVNGLEQNSFSVDLLFAMGNEARAKATRWLSTADHDELAGEHAGFNARGFHHSRTFRFDKHGRGIAVIDEVSGNGAQSLAGFHLCPGVEPVAVREGTYRIGGATIAFMGHDRIAIEDSWYSAAYGKREIIRCLKVHFGERLETHISVA